MVHRSVCLVLRIDQFNNDVAWEPSLLYEANLVKLSWPFHQSCPACDMVLTFVLQVQMNTGTTAKSFTGG